MAKTNKDVAVKNLTEALGAILSAKDRGKWFSIRERPIGPFLSEANVPPRYYKSIVNVLEERGILTKTGKTKISSYKLEENIRYANSFLADVVYETFMKDSVSGYPPSSRSDLSPKSYSSHISKKLSGEPQEIQRKRVYVGDKQYAIIDNAVQECMVVSVFCDFDVNDKDEPVFIPNRINLTVVYSSVQDVDGKSVMKQKELTDKRGRFFDTPEDVAQYLINTFNRALMRKS